MMPARRGVRLARYVSGRVTEKYLPTVGALTNTQTLTKLATTRYPTPTTKWPSQSHSAIDLRSVGVCRTAIDDPSRRRVEKKNKTTSPPPYPPKKNAARRLQRRQRKKKQKSDGENEVTIDRLFTEFLLNFFGCCRFFLKIYFTTFIADANSF